jgi:hypothetical protein
MQQDQPQPQYIQYQPQPVEYEDFYARNFKPLPISRWNLKFEGDGATLLDFLNKVEIFSVLERTPKYEILRSAFYLFGGPASNWYLTNRHKFGSYTQLVEGLKRTFLRCDNDLELKREIEQREQLPNESFIQYLTDIERKCQQLATPMPENEKLFILRKNMNNFYSSKLAAHDVNTVEQLEELCRRIETFNRPNRSSSNNNQQPQNRQRFFSNNIQVSSNNNNYSKNFTRNFRVSELDTQPDSETEMERETEPVMALRTVTQFPVKKTIACQTDNNPPTMTENNILIPGNHQRVFLYPQPGHPVGNAYLQPVPVPNFVSQSNMSIPAAQNLVPITPIQNFGPVHPQFNQQLQNQQNGPGIGRQQPPPNQNRSPMQCHNCKKFGHSFRECRVPQSRPFCYRCGMENVVTSNCPFCAGNGQ